MYCRATLAFVFALLVGSAATSWGQEAVKIGFDSADDVKLFKPLLKADQDRYTHEPSNGPGGKAGWLASRNTGEQGEALYYAKQTFDLTTQSIEVSVLFKAGANVEPSGQARIMLALAKGDNVNVVAADGKFGVRLFRPEAPKDPANPWQLQISNGFSVRDIDKPLALEPDHWYLLKGTFALTPDRKTISFDLLVHEQGVDGATPGLVRRAGAGRTAASKQYDVTKLHLALLGQYNGGGAVGFDDLQITVRTPEQARAAAADAAPVETVKFVAPVLDPSLRAPGNSIFGVVGHAIHTSHFYPDKDDYWEPARVLPLKLAANVSWVREAMYQPWFANRERKDVDKHRASFESYLELYDRHGVNVVLCIMAVSPGDQWEKYNADFFDYVATLAGKYKCVRVVEMHNEPNLKFFWRGTPEQYVEVYRPAAAKVKAARADVRIAVGSLSSLWWPPGIEWFDRAVAAGVLDFADAIAVHPYNRVAAPENDPHFAEPVQQPGAHLSTAVNAWWTRYKEKIPTGRDVRLYFTELGYSSAAEGIAGVGSEARQADYLSRLMLLYLDMRLNGTPLDAVFWYDFKDDGAKADLGEHNFGLVTWDTARPKQAYGDFTRIAGYFSDPRDLEPAATVKVVSSNLPHVAMALAWRRKSDGATIIPFWMLSEPDVGRTEFATELRIQGLPAGTFSVTLHDPRQALALPVGSTSSEDKLCVPVLVQSHAKWLEIRAATAPAGGRQ